MARVAVGCAMWANRAWVGRYWPAGTRVGDELANYVRWCDAVEGNTTFYALPAASTVSRWRDAAPPDFRFVFKLPRSLTHERRLRDVDAELLSFLRLLAPLGERLHTITAQLPPSFGVGDLGALAAFFRRAPREVDGVELRWAVELRAPEFFDGGRAEATVERMLTDRGVERVILDSRTLFASPPTDDAEREAWNAKPRLPVPEHALTDRPIVRLIGRNDVAATRAGWAPWMAVMARWVREGRSPTVFVHTADNVEVLPLAYEFWSRVSAVVAIDGRLPPPSIAPDQPQLFD